MRGKLYVRLIGALLLSPAVLVSSMTAFAASERVLLNSTFDDSDSQWAVSASEPAELDGSVKDGTYQVKIINNGGKEDGGVSRWDCQLIARNLKIEAGCLYALHAEVTSDAAGEIYTVIGNAAGDKEIWHNGYGEANESYGAGWNCVTIGEGQKLIFECTFTSLTDMDNAQWAWQFGGAGDYQEKDCFPDGTTLTFDNLSLICKTPKTDDETDDTENAGVSEENVDWNTFGDVNLDDAITVSDAIIISRIATEDITLDLNNEAKSKADLNQDGVVNGTDMTFLLRHIAKESVPEETQENE